MERIQLLHPEGKKAPTMDRAKYEALKAVLSRCLKTRKTASFDELLADVAADLKNNNMKIPGVLRWNLFWVTLDMEANNLLKRNKKVSQHQYTI